jgi:hypothetical protein
MAKRRRRQPAEVVPVVEPVMVGTEITVTTMRPQIIDITVDGSHENDLLKCPICGHIDNIDNYDCLGADDACVFCNECNTELAL